MALSPDLDSKPSSQIIGINSTSTWGCWHCQKKSINQILFVNMDHTHILVSGFIMFMHIPIPLILLHLAKSITYGPFDYLCPQYDIKLFNYVLDMTLNYLVSSWIWCKTIPLCPTSGAFSGTVVLIHVTLVLYSCIKIHLFHFCHIFVLNMTINHSCLHFMAASLTVSIALSFAFDRFALSMALNYSFCPWYDDKLSLFVFVLTMAALTPVLPSWTLHFMAAFTHRFLPWLQLATIHLPIGICTMSDVSDM